MANAVVSRIQGDDYQARVFWAEATRLFEDSPVATEVAFEVDDAKGFDDVVVFYGGDRRDPYDPKVLADYFQVKFHVAQDGSFTAAAFCDPGFIGATKTSLLQRFHNAQRRHAPNGTEARFIVIAPWSIDHADPLGKLYSNYNGSLRLDRLGEGGKRSEMGRLRQMWRDHLGVATDEELLQSLGALRIRTDYPALDGMVRQLNPQLIRAGMKPFPEATLNNPYDALPLKLLQSGQRRFTRDQLVSVLTRENLTAPRAVVSRTQGRQLGIRSFLRWAEHMEDETERTLCLIPHFHSRRIVDRDLWSGVVGPAVRDFLTEATQGARIVDLHLDTHMSVAFTAGWFLDSKSGVMANVVQRSLEGQTTWCTADLQPCRDTEVWSTRVIDVDDNKPDLAVVLSVTRQALAEAEPFIRTQLPSVGRVLELTPCSGASSASVRDAAHARRLADDIASIAAGLQQAKSRQSTIHLMAAAPNGLVFFLGQAARVWGRCVLYEHDWDKTQPVAYEASLSLPLT